MASIVGIFEGGTAGLMDGTLVSSGGAGTQPIDVSALDTSVPLMYRMIDDGTEEDPGEDTPSTILAETSASLEVSFDDATFSASEEGPVATGGNQPIYLQQTDYVSSGTLSITYGTPVAGARVAQVGAVTAIPALAQVTLAWSDIAMEAHGFYEVQRATDDAFTAGLVTLTDSLADGATGYVNNAANGNAPVAGATYYYRVRARDQRGVGQTWRATGAVTLMAVGDDTNGGLLLEETFANLNNWCGNNPTSPYAFNDAVAPDSQFTAVGGKLHFTGTNANARWMAVKSTALSATLADAVVEAVLEVGTNSFGGGSNNNDSLGIAMRATEAERNTDIFWAARSGLNTSIQYLWKCVNGSWTQMTGDASTTADQVVAGDVLVMSESSTTAGRYRNGTQDDTGASGQTSGRIAIRFSNGNNDGASIDLFDTLRVMKSSTVTVTGLPAGYKAELVDAHGATTVKVTESSGTATLNGHNTAVTALASGSKFRYAGGATLNIYNAADVLVASKANVTGGGSYPVS